MRNDGGQDLFALQQRQAAKIARVEPENIERRVVNGSALSLHSVGIPPIRTGKISRRMPRASTPYYCADPATRAEYPILCKNYK